RAACEIERRGTEQRAPAATRNERAVRGQACPQGTGTPAHAPRGSRSREPDSRHGQFIPDWRLDFGLTPEEWAETEAELQTNARLARAPRTALSREHDEREGGRMAKPNPRLRPPNIAFHCKRCGRTGTAAHRSDGEGAGRASNVSAVSEAFRRVGALRIGRARGAVDYPGGRPIVTQGLPIAL